MRLDLKNRTQRSIQDIFKTVSYHNSITRVSSPNKVRYALIDSLLTAYWNSQYTRCNNLAKACEHMSKKAIIAADIDIRTSESIHTAHLGTSLSGGGL